MRMREAHLSLIQKKKGKSNRINVGDVVKLKTYIENEKITSAPKVTVKNANNNTLILTRIFLF